MVTCVPTAQRKEELVTIAAQVLSCVRPAGTPPAAAGGDRDNTRKGQEQSDQQKLG